jgi:fatty acid desaturase
MSHADAEACRYLALIEELAVPDPRIYWGDFLLSAAAFYAGFGVLVLFRLPRPGQAALFVACSVLAFRCAAFLHEIVHQGPERLPGFGTAYNLLFGYVFKLPTFVYTPHLEHHSPRVFSTEADPEYTPWGARPGLDLIGYTLICALVFPGLLVLRFGLLPIVDPLLGERVRLWIDRKASTLGTNLRYRREVGDDAERRAMRCQERCCALYNAALLILTLVGAWPWRAFVLWYAVTGVGMTINFFRGSINHGYARRGPAVTFDAMIADSINVTGGSLWSRFWSPLNTRYHALHHLYPLLPYHALPAAHERLMASLPPGHIYRSSNKATYFEAFRDLIGSRGRSRPEAS